MIPTEETEVLEFVPLAFKETENPPTILLRSPNDRHIRRYDMVCGEMNLEIKGPKDFHEQRRAAIKALRGEQAQSILERFNSIIACADQGIDVSDDDNQWFDHLSNQLFDEWPPLARMKAKNAEWQKWAPEVSMSTMVIGWKNLKSEFQKDGIYASFKSIQRATDEIWEMEKALPDGATFQSSYIELWGACQKQMNLTEEEAKNSLAPSQPSLTPAASTESNQADGASIEESGADESSSTSSTKTKTPAVS